MLPRRVLPPCCRAARQRVYSRAAALRGLSSPATVAKQEPDLPGFDPGVVVQARRDMLSAVGPAVPVNTDTVLTQQEFEAIMTMLCKRPLVRSAFARSGNTVCIVASGTAESIALAILAKEWADAQPKPVRLVGIYIDHRLLGGVTGVWQSVKASYAALGVPVVVLPVSWDNSTPKVRRERYRLLSDTCKAQGAA